MATPKANMKGKRTAKATDLRNRRLVNVNEFKTREFTNSKEIGRKMDQCSAAGKVAPETTHHSSYRCPPLQPKPDVKDRDSFAEMRLQLIDHLRQGNV